MAARKSKPEKIVIMSLPEDLMEEIARLNVDAPSRRDFDRGYKDPLVLDVFSSLTDEEGVTTEELVAAANQLERHPRLAGNSGRKKLAARLRSFAKDPPAEMLGVGDTETISLKLTDEELDGLGWIANRYESGRILYGAYNDEDGTFDLDEVTAAYRATATDGGNVGVVPNAGGTLAEKINWLFENSGAYDLDLEDE